jgi:aspartokinase
MITIPEVVQQIVTREPLVEEGLQKGIINLSAYARSIRPQIEDILMKRVQSGAIVMALRRMQVASNQNKVLSGFFHIKPNIIIRSNLTEYTLENSNRSLAAVIEIIRQNAHNHRHIVAITQGVYETALIVNSEWENEAVHIIPQSAIIDIVRDLSAITITLPPSNVETPGVYYTILKSLAWKGINVFDVVSTKNEFTILFEDKDVDSAFTVIKSVFI